MSLLPITTVAVNRAAVTGTQLGGLSGTQVPDGYPGILNGHLDIFR